jgi:hypothetical protein
MFDDYRYVGIDRHYSLSLTKNQELFKKINYRCIIRDIPDYTQIFGTVKGVAKSCTSCSYTCDMSNGVCQGGCIRLNFLPRPVASCLTAIGTTANGNDPVIQVLGARAYRKTNARRSGRVG